MGVIWSTLQIFCLACCCPKNAIQSMVTSILKRTSGPCCCCLQHHQQQPLSPTRPSASHPKFKPPQPPDQPELSGSPVASKQPLFGEKVHVPPGTSGGAHPVNTRSDSEAMVTTAAASSPHPLLSSSTPRSPHTGDEFSRYQHYSAASEEAGHGEERDVTSPRK
jgi:hypothetical protein